MDPRYDWRYYNFVAGLAMGVIGFLIFIITDLLKR